MDRLFAGFSSSKKKREKKNVFSSSETEHPVAQRSHSPFTAAVDDFTSAPSIALGSNGIVDVPHSGPLDLGSAASITRSPLLLKRGADRTSLQQPDTTPFHSGQFDRASTNSITLSAGTSTSTAGISTPPHWPPPAPRDFPAPAGLSLSTNGRNSTSSADVRATAPQPQASPRQLSVKTRIAPLIRCNAGRYIVSQVASGGNGRVYKCITTAANMPELRPEDVLADSGVQWNNPNPQPVPEGQDEQGPHPLEGSPEDEFERDAEIMARIYSRMLKAKERLGMEAVKGYLPDGSLGRGSMPRQSMARDHHDMAGAHQYGQSSRMSAAASRRSRFANELTPEEIETLQRYGMGHMAQHRHSTRMPDAGYGRPVGASQRMRLGTVPHVASGRPSMLRFRAGSNRQRRAGSAGDAASVASTGSEPRHGAQKPEAPQAPLANPAAATAAESQGFGSRISQAAVGDIDLPSLVIPEASESGVEHTPSSKAPDGHTTASSPLGRTSNTHVPASGEASEADTAAQQAGKARSGNRPAPAPLQLPGGAAGLPEALVPAQEAEQSHATRQGRGASMPSSPSETGDNWPRKRAETMQQVPRAPFHPAHLPTVSSAAMYMPDAAYSMRVGHHGWRAAGGPPLPGPVQYMQRLGYGPDVGSMRRYPAPQQEAPATTLQRLPYSMRRSGVNRPAGAAGAAVAAPPAPTIPAAPPTYPQRPSTIPQRPPPLPTMQEPAAPVPLGKLQSRRSSRRMSVRVPGGSGGRRGGLALDLDTCQKQGMWTTHGFMEASSHDGEEGVVIPSDLQQLADQDIKKVRKLGQGQFGCVHLALWCGVEVALKELHHTSMTDEQHQEVFMEAQRLAALRHPCVIAFYGITTSPDSYGTVVEYCPSGNLVHALRLLRQQGPVTRSTKASIALQAARGMEYLHSQGVVHFDLKGENLLCDLRDLSRPVVKIGDMGLSRVKEDKDDRAIKGKMKGTLPWMAPELFPGWTMPKNTSRKRRSQPNAAAPESPPAAPAIAPTTAPAKMPWDDDYEGDDDPAAPPRMASDAESDGGQWVTDGETTDDGPSLDDEHVTEAVDIYSFAIVLWEVWTLGETPYQNMDRAELMHGIMEGVVRPDVPLDCDREWTKLMTDCWGANPNKRPSFTQIAARLQAMVEPFNHPHDTPAQPAVTATAAATAAGSDASAAGPNTPAVAAAPAAAGSVSPDAPAAGSPAKVLEIPEAELAADLARAQAEEIASPHMHRLPWGGHADHNRPEPSPRYGRSHSVTSHSRTDGGLRLSLQTSSMRRSRPPLAPLQPQPAAAAAATASDKKTSLPELPGQNGTVVGTIRVGPPRPARLQFEMHSATSPLDASPNLSPIPASPPGWTESTTDNIITSPDGGATSGWSECGMSQRLHDDVAAAAVAAAKAEAAEPAVGAAAAATVMKKLPGLRLDVGDADGQQRGISLSGGIA